MSDGIFMEAAIPLEPVLKLARQRRMSQKKVYQWLLECAERALVEWEQEWPQFTGVREAYEWCRDNPFKTNPAWHTGARNPATVDYFACPNVDPEFIAMAMSDLYEDFCVPRDAEECWNSAYNIAYNFQQVKDETKYHEEETWQAVRLLRYLK